MTAVISFGHSPLHITPGKEVIFTASGTISNVPIVATDASYTWTWTIKDKADAVVYNGTGHTYTATFHLKGSYSVKLDLTGAATGNVTKSINVTSIPNNTTIIIVVCVVVAVVLIIIAIIVIVVVLRKKKTKNLHPIVAHAVNQL